MTKIKSSLENIRADIEAFYDASQWHFITLNGLELKKDVLEVQWIFSKYEALDELIVYYVEIAYDALIPNVGDIIPSAMISQREIVDMFGARIEGSAKGLYLDEDSLQMPLSSCAYNVK